jgi:hypothetical protein
MNASMSTLLVSHAPLASRSRFCSLTTTLSI